MNKSASLSLGVLGLIAGFAVSDSAWAQCVRRTPSMVILSNAQAKVTPMAPQNIRGERATYFMPAASYNAANHRVRITNNDDPGCGASRLGVGLGDVSAQWVSAPGSGVMVNGGQSLDIDVAQTLPGFMQPGSVSIGEGHACRGALDIHNRIWLSDCGPAVQTQLIAMMGPPQLSLNGDSTLNRGVQNALQISSSLRSLALQATATTSEANRQIRAWLGPVNCSANGECLWANGDPQTIMLCETGANTCSVNIKPNRMPPGMYRLIVHATNQPDSNNIHYGNGMNWILQIQ